MDDKLAYLIMSGVGVLALTFIGLYLKRLADDSRSNADSINSVSGTIARVHNEVIATFATKAEFNDVRGRVGSLERDVTQLQVVTGVKR